MSTVSELCKDPAHSIGQFVQPRFQPSGLGFLDLAMQATGGLRGIAVRVCYSVIVEEARFVPAILPVDGVVISSYHVRMVLFDRVRFLGNVLTLRATTSGGGAAWKFNKASAFPGYSDSDNVCLVRTDNVDSSLCLLFELCATVRQASGQTDDVSCGFATLPLIQQVGSHVPFKSYELKLWGGTPFETEVPVCARKEKRGEDGRRGKRKKKRAEERERGRKKDPTDACSLLVFDTCSWTLLQGRLAPPRSLAPAARWSRASSCSKQLSPRKKEKNTLTYSQLRVVN
jgi:hypothetical protein